MSWEWLGIMGDVPGGQKFIAPILAFNMASTSWKAFIDQVQRCRDETEEQVRRILANNRFYNSTLPENQVAVQGCVKDAIPAWHSKHDALWEKTRRWAWAMNILAFGMLYFEMSTPVSVILAAPIPTYLSLKQWMKYCMGKDLDTKVTQSCQALDTSIRLGLSAIIKPHT